MKLSDIRGDKTLDVIADLIVPVSNIAMDEVMAGVFERVEVDGKTAEEVAADRLREAVPGLIRSHKDDVIDILAAISMTDRQEYVRDLNLATLVRDLYELINDGEFIGFFTSVVADQTSTDGSGPTTDL